MGQLLRLTVAWLAPLGPYDAGDCQNPPGCGVAAHLLTTQCARLVELCRQSSGASSLLLQLEAAVSGHSEFLGAWLQPPRMQLEDLLDVPGSQDLTFRELSGAAGLRLRYMLRWTWKTYPSLPTRLWNDLLGVSNTGIIPCLHSGWNTPDPAVRCRAEAAAAGCAGPRLPAAAGRDAPGRSSLGVPNTLTLRCAAGLKLPLLDALDLDYPLQPAKTRLKNARWACPTP